MKRPVAVVTLCTLLMTPCLRGMCLDDDHAAAFKRVVNATVQVFTHYAQSNDKATAVPVIAMTTGFFISPNIVACDLHDVRGAESLIIASRGAIGQRIAVRGALAYDAENDIVLLSVEGDHEFLEFGELAGDAEVPVFTQVLSRGYVACTAVRHTSKWDPPANLVPDPKFRWPDLDVMELTGPWVRDNNDFGMPVVNAAGRVIGVYAFFAAARGEDWMMPAEHVSKLLASSKDAALMPLSALGGTGPSRAERLGLTRSPDTNIVLGSDTQHTTLKGIKAVTILVVGPGDDIQKEGLGKASIRTDVELKLREAGIEVFLEAKVDTPTFVVSVNAIVRSDDNTYAYDLECELDDDVRMENRSKNVVVLSAPIWKAAGVIGVVGGSRVSTIRDTIKDQVDKFLVDYLKANPKR